MYGGKEVLRARGAVDREYINEITRREVERSEEKR
jgi:mannitol/fructose-specific phosphotransferase system IIA component